MRIGVGIDTGGTYTDAVVYDFESDRILGSAKALTTKENLSIGILEALDKLPIEIVRKTELVSLSTTLATNACVEDKGGSAKLVFFGGHEREVNELGGSFGLPSADDMLIQESYTTFSGEMTGEPDWDSYCEAIERDFRDLDGVGIVEVYANNNGAVVEKKAKALFSERFDTPVVCGHELFSELSCMKRASSTLLNARLFPVIKDFLRAIKLAMREREIVAPVVIVRSDGSLMSEDFAMVHPVETLLCGPAASVIGGASLSKSKNCIVVDMGGTTTDIAIVKDYQPVSVVDGVEIGKWKTFVDGFFVKTVGLGGDSAIHYKEGRLLLEEYRVVPLCIASEKYPVITENLRELAQQKRKHTKYLFEHYLLNKEISNHSRYTEEEKAFCRALKEGPLSVREAPLAVGKDMYTFSAARLLREGVIQMCGLTPTDIMHIKGDFARYPTEASRLGAEFAAANLEVTVEELCELVYDEVNRKIYNNIVKIMMEHKYPTYGKTGISKDVERFIDESSRAALARDADSFLSLMLRTEFTLVGIGAPIRMFLPRVAEMLGTSVAIPEHYEVANAVGAIVGNISANYKVEVRSSVDDTGLALYTVYGVDGNRTFEELADAEAFAVEEARKGAEQAARNRGATGDISVTCQVNTQEGQAENSVVYLGTTVLANAVGKH